MTIMTMTNPEEYPEETVSLGDLVDRLNDFLESYQCPYLLENQFLKNRLREVEELVDVCRLHGYRECWCQYRLLHLAFLPPGRERDHHLGILLMEYQLHQEVHGNLDPIGYHNRSDAIQRELQWAQNGPISTLTNRKNKTDYDPTQEVINLI